MKTHSTNPNLSEPRWLRVLLTATALGFLLLMLVCLWLPYSMKP